MTFRPVNLTIVHYSCSLLPRTVGGQTISTTRARGISSQSPLIFSLYRENVGETGEMRTWEWSEGTGSGRVLKRKECNTILRRMGYVDTSSDVRSKFIVCSRRSLAAGIGNTSEHVCPPLLSEILEKFNLIIRDSIGWQLILRSSTDNLSRLSHKIKLPTLASNSFAEMTSPPLFVFHTESHNWWIAHVRIPVEYRSRNISSKLLYYRITLNHKKDIYSPINTHLEWNNIRHGN